MWGCLNVVGLGIVWLVVLVVVGAILELFGVMPPFPVLAGALAGTALVLGICHDDRRTERQQAEAQKQAKRAEDNYRAHMVYQRSLLGKLQEATTFEEAQSIYESADDGSEVKRLAWSKMQRLV